MAALREGPVHDVSVEHRTLRVDGDDVPVVHARPDGPPRAGLVLHPDLGGNRPLFDDMARRLATHGLAVACVEPFARFDRDKLDSVEVRMAKVPELDDATQLGDLEAAANLLVVDDDVSTISVLGFCMGGYYTLKAATSDRFDRAVSFYGMITTPEHWRGPGHKAPLATAADVCPTLAIFGSADPWTPKEDIDALRQAWSARDDCEIVVIDGADHGFVHDPDRPAHRPDDAAQVWARALEWISAI
ncbi:MAG TPA: dienelactone hydrolase family protein [Acidimicrobiia bacterium]|nr:dienelactone hydrolase family protein [Acidimicrobiia bacterium]